MAGAIANSLYEVYKTAATELGLANRQAKQAAFNRPPGVEDPEELPPPTAGHGHSHAANGGACSHSSSGAAAAAAGAVASAAAAVDIFEAARQCDLNFLRRVASGAGSEDALCLRDGLGHSAAHWASLYGHVAVLQLLADSGPAGLALCHQPSRHELGQRPIHWACVNGHVPVVELLLRLSGGSDIDARDGKGATPLVVACQYGQTVTAGYLLSRGAGITEGFHDAEGDTALHWAAFKGRPDLMRLLVYSGFNPHQRDNFGQTPLHLAAIAGNINAVRDLCRIDKVELNVADKNGKTPLMLAAGRRHVEVERFLKAEIRTRASVLGARFRLSHLVFGPPGKSKAPMLFLLFCILVWGYPTYVLKAVPLTFHLYPWLHWVFLLANGVMWVSFYHASVRDPGYLPRNVPDYDRAIRQAGLNSADIGLGRVGNPLERLCHSCRCVRPVRAKHCRVCDRCVLEMDHHCPYIYNCVGRNNRFWFGILTASLMSLASMTCLLAFVTLLQGGMDWLMCAGVVATLFALAVSSVVSSCVWYHAARNLTTNESMNKKRYAYLKDPATGSFRNPFDRGAATNLLEFCHLRSPKYSLRDLSEIKVSMDV